MTKLTKFLGFVGITAILAMVFAACFTVFKAAFTDIAGLGDFISAFTGAFFAFIFVKLGELGTRLYVRQRANQVALVTFEQIFQECINRLYGNDFVADDIIKTIETTVSSPDDTIKVNFNYLKPIPANTTPMIDLRNIDFKNDLLNFYEDLEKLNNSLDAIQRFYEIMTVNLMSGQLTRDVYVNNYNGRPILLT